MVRFVCGHARRTGATRPWHGRTHSYHLAMHWRCITLVVRLLLLCEIVCVRPRRTVATPLLCTELHTCFTMAERL